MDYLEKFITDNFHGWTAFGMIVCLLVAVFLLVEVIRNAIKHRYDKKLEEHKSKLNQDKDSAKLKINAEMIMQHTDRKDILINVEVINTGKRPCFIKSVTAVLQPSTRTIVGSTLPPLVDSPEEIDNLLTAPQKGVVEIKPDGASFTWIFKINVNPHLRPYIKDGDTYGKGFVEVTSGERLEYFFLMLPDDAWNFLTAPIAPVFDGQTGHRCSRCGFMFLKQADATSVVCPKCKQVDVLKSEQFPAPPDLSNKPRERKTFFALGPEEITLDALTFHILKAYSNFTSPNAAMSVDMVSHYCQITRDEALPAVQELFKMKLIRVLVIMPGEWNSHYQITPAGRNYVMQHAT